MTLLFGAGEGVERDAVEDEVGVLAGVHEGEAAGAALRVDVGDPVEAVPPLATHVVPQLQLAGGLAFGGHEAILLAEFGELVGGEAEVDHNGAALAQGVLDDVDGLEVGVGAAEHLEDRLVGREAAYAANLLLCGGVEEKDGRRRPTPESRL